MSVPRCGWCSAPTMVGAICRDHWRELEALLDRCRGLEADLAASAARQTRSGETTGRSTTIPLPVNLDAVDARRALSDALDGALRPLVVAMGDSWPRLSIDGAVAALTAHRGRLRASWVAPVLYGDLLSAVPRAVSVLQPRGRLMVRVPCPRCGGGPLSPVGGMLECRGCRERMTVAEVRGSTAA